MSESKALSHPPVDRIKKIAGSKIVKTAILAAVVGLGTASNDAPFNPPIPTPEPTSQDEARNPNYYDAYLARVAALRENPNNRDAYVWPNFPAYGSPFQLDHRTVEEKRAWLEGRLGGHLSNGMSFEFHPVYDPLPTFRFFKSNVAFKGVPIGFIDTSGRFPKDKLTRRKGYSPEEVINYLPELEPAFYLRPDLKDHSPQHVVGIPAEKVPKNGYVIVFSRPTADEKPESKTDVWETNGGLISEVLKVKSPGESKVKEVYYLMTDTRDSINRLSPFYNKHNPAEVRKVIVIFDSGGQAVNKITLDTTPFLPRDEQVDNSSINASLINQEYLDRHAKQLSFDSFASMTWQERNEKLKSLVGRSVRLLIDKPDVRLEHYPVNPTQKNHWLTLGAFPKDNSIDPEGGIPIIFDDYTTQSLSLKSRETGEPRYKVELPNGTKLFLEVTPDGDESKDSKGPVIRFRGIKYPK